MRVSELWLRTFINLRNGDVNPSHSLEVLIESLVNAGIEVDALEKSEENPKDTIMTLKIPPTRGDCFSMEGIARELSALCRLPYQVIEEVQVEPKSDQVFPVRVSEGALCPRYLGRVISGIDANKKIPDWMLERLNHAGLRSISAVVDICNYVMLEIGQPLHAFDLHKLDSGVVVRKAKENEKIVLLDEKEVTLVKDVLVIADKNKPHAIAGIMGGLESSVTENTKDIFLESAFFDPVSIRLSGQKLGIRSDSSHRFERGIDPFLQRKGIERATELVLEIVGGSAGPIVEVKDENKLPSSKPVSLRRSKIDAVLGLCPDDKEILDILNRLHMKVESIQAGFLVTAPSFRLDIQLEEDLIEEIARVYGYERIPLEMPIVPFESHNISEKKISLTSLKEVLVGRGYSEAITYSFLEPEMVKLFAKDATIFNLQNPISQDMAAMRTSLLPGLVKVLQYNQRRQMMRVRLFESGLCFNEEHGKLNQKPFLAGLWSGNAEKEQWGMKTRPVDFFDIKKDVEALLQLKGLNLNDTKSGLQFLVETHASMHPGQTAKIQYKGEDLGYVGALHPHIIKALDLEGPVVAFELDLLKLEVARIKPIHEVSKFPAIRRDIAVIVPETVLAAKLKSAIVNSAGSLLKDVSVFDVYQGKGIEKGRKSVALSLILQQASRTLTEGEVNDCMGQVVQALKQECEAVLRE